ncbi:MAG TPA: dihydrofolate reductase [Balneolales bacterium]|nr:dihydrofolate reductase [Balneolales bacterium]
MKIALIAAHTDNLVIGKNNSIPWHYSEDLKRFKRLTMGHPIIMGRKTFESIGSKPLPGRENIVISRTQTFDNVTCFQSVDDAIQATKNNDTIFIIGGSQLYQATLTKADLLYITEVHDIIEDVERIVYFPEYRDKVGKIWKETFREDHGNFSFVNYERL